MLALVAVALSGAAGCGDGNGGGGAPAVAQRADQVHRAARAAGLSDEVADVLSLAARGAGATFQVTYAGTDGAQVTVSQEPPNRRIDVLTAGLIVESQVVRDGVGYRCTLPTGGHAGDPLRCRRTHGAIEAEGTFTAEALDRFTDALAASVDSVELTVETRTIAEVEARCLVSAPKAGSSLDDSGGSVDTICLSPDGAQLLVDSGGQRTVADSYSTTVPSGTFDV